MVVVMVVVTVKTIDNNVATRIKIKGKERSIAGSSIKENVQTLSANTLTNVSIVMENMEYILVLRRGIENLLMEEMAE